MTCFPCDQQALGDDAPLSERIAGDAHWRVVHAFGVSLPGWLVLLPRRHVLTMAELTDVEAAWLGCWQVRLSRALHDVTGCTKTYVMQFAEAEGFGHVHVHVVPRMPNQDTAHRGPGVFALMPADAALHLSQADRDAVSARLAPLLA